MRDTNKVSLIIIVVILKEVTFRNGMVPVTGFEPARYFYRGILSPMCLPIPPHRHII